MTIKVGEFGIYPCAICAIEIEDVRTEDDICSDCGSQERIRDRERAAILELIQKRLVSCKCCVRGWRVTGEDALSIITEDAEKRAKARRHKDDEVFEDDEPTEETQILAE